jgi:hypothetical protein
MLKVAPIEKPFMIGDGIYKVTADEKIEPVDRASYKGPYLTP